MPIARNQHVLRLQITINDIILMQILNRHRYLTYINPRLKFCQPISSLLPQNSSQISTRAILQNQKQLRSSLEALLHLYYKGIPNGFLQYSLLLLCICKKVLFGDEGLILYFHSVLVSRFQVFDQIDLAEGAATDVVDELVAVNDGFAFR